MERKPIKRNENLVPLSRDHHGGLLCCWKIRQGLQKQVEIGRIKNYVLYFWENYLLAHLQEEETLLFKGLNDPLCTKALLEHRDLEKLIGQLKTEMETTSMLTRLADFLESHIRFEERQLFPHLENTIPASELKQIGAALTAAHANAPAEHYPDAFWVRHAV